MKRLIFATRNTHKTEEVRAMLPPEITLLGLDDVGCSDDLPETHETIEENAVEKAMFVFDRFAIPCFAEDSGLEVEALNGAPGVHSAHYAGTRDANANISQLLKNLHGIENRSARFKTVFALIADNRIYCFEGIVTGKIAESPMGTGGFGYDPVFIPDGYDATFATLGPEIKNLISHRAKAWKKLSDFLSTQL